MMAELNFNMWLVVGLININMCILFAHAPSQQLSTHDPLNKTAFIFVQTPNISKDSSLLKSVLQKLENGKEPNLLLLRRLKRGFDERDHFFPAKPVKFTPKTITKHFYEEGAYIGLSEEAVKQDLYQRSTYYKNEVFTDKLTIIESKPEVALQGATEDKIYDKYNMDIYRSKSLSVTQLEWKHGLDSQNNPIVEVWGEMGDAQVKFGMYENGVVNHLHGLGQSGSNWYGKVKLATFSGDEVNMFPPPPKISLDTRDENKENKRARPDGSDDDGGESSNKRICHRGLSKRRKRGTGCGCAICLNVDGEVDSVDSKRFFEEYKKAGYEEQEEMGKIGKGKMNGEVVDDNTEDSSTFREKASDLIDLEDIKTHARVVDFVSNVQSSESGGKFKESVEKLSNRLTSMKNNVMMKLSNSKVAQKLNSISNSEGGKDFVQAVDMVAKPLGYYFLAKALISGIANRDVETLSIIGARVGYQAAVWAGKNYLSSASTLGSLATKLGKWAGPIGGAMDIGLNVYSIVKSVKRLQSATNQYQRNAAIADIVSDSVDIAATATVVGLSLAFPLSAPFISSVGIVFSLFRKLIVGSYKAMNEVNRINLDIKVLEHEESAIFWKYVIGFGAENLDYLDHLVEEKQANDIAVGRNVEFLKNNQDFLGVVFPSRTLSVDGGCILQRKECHSYGFGFNYAWSCGHWSFWRTEATGCDLNRHCSVCHGVCMNHTERGKSRYAVAYPYHKYCDGLDVRSYIPPDHIYFWNEYECICREKAKFTYGYPRTNSLVDFRSKKKVFRERAVPKDLDGADFMCKPGSKSFQGGKLHEESSRNEYLCENAIAIIQPKGKRKDGQILLFDLEDGNDSVFLNSLDSTPTLFRVGESGTKEFIGGAGRNEFLFDSNCSSLLKGKLEGGSTDGDVLNIENSCGIGTSLHLDFGNGSMKTQDGNVNMELNSVENFLGRLGEGDEVVAGCNSRRITGRGGNAWVPDQINIPARNGCSYNLKVTAAEHTTILSKATMGHITIIVERTVSSIGVGLDVHPNDLKISLIFLSTPSAQVVLKELKLEESTIYFKVEDITQTNSTGEGTKIDLNFEGGGGDQNLPIHFNEMSPSSSQYSTLIISSSYQPVFYHTLSDLRKNGNEELRRVGNPSIQNVFQISGPNWNVVGGDRSDKFILNSPHISNLKLEGGNGDDILTIQAELPEIDLRKFSSVENVEGVSGVPVSVICDCETKSVMGMGGSEDTPDIVRIPSSKECANRQLQVFVKGHSKVVVGELGEREKIAVVALASSITSTEQNEFLRFEMETKSENSMGLVLAIQLSHKNWKTIPGVKSSDGNLANLRLAGVNEEHIQLILNIDGSKSEQFLSSPQIQISQLGSNEPTTQLLIERESLTTKVLWHLNINQTNTTNKVKEVVGFTGIPNWFEVSSGSWRIIGGNLSDTVIIFSTAQSETISVIGGSGQDNVVILEPSEKNVTYGINFETGEMGFLHSKQKGEIRNIAHILGRPENPDSIHVGCNTKSVNGRGGAGKRQSDLIFISEKGCDSHPDHLEISVDEFTKVKNSRRFGEFSYQVSSLLTADLELNSLATNQHILKFGHAAWGQIKAITFNKKEHILGFQVDTSSESQEKVHFFNMFGKSESQEYSNPVFEFQAQPGVPVKGELHVGKDGVTMATILVQGTVPKSVDRLPLLPVHLNRFVIKISADDEDEKSGLETKRAEGLFDRSIIGSSTAKANQFWILELNSTLLQLDGGDCVKNGCVNYLHLGETLEIGKRIEMNLHDDDKGYLASDRKMVISQLRNFNEISGRKGGNDTLLLFSCQLRQASEMEFVAVNHDVANNCTFNLTIEIGENTQVSLRHVAPLHGSSVTWDNSIFHYHFKQPTSFDPSGNAWLGPTHNYYLSFKAEELESIRFEVEQETLYYVTNGKQFYHTMLVARMAIEDQFYTQPQIVLKDGFKINIGRDGNILLVKGESVHVAPHDIRSKVIPELESTAAKLGVTLMLQTETQLFYVGHAKADRHGNAVEDRNVLENTGDLESHLVGGGESDTIYEITSLQKDVYIYTGFEDAAELSEEELRTTIKSKQTMDLTDIVVPIRKESRTKYVPKVKVRDEDIIIEMYGYMNDHPGKIWIINGRSQQVAQRLQLLLNNAIMDLVPVKNKLVKRDTEENVVEWEIHPRPILITEGMVYSISPDDLEDNHQFRVDINSNSTFQPVKKGADLFLTNVALTRDKSPQELAETTTVVISDYFEESKVKTSEEENVGKTNHIYFKTDQKSPLAEVKGVVISVPGLTLWLNDSKIGVVLNISGTMAQNEIGTQQAKNIFTTTVLLEWHSVLQVTEEKLLYNMPDIPRVFARPKQSTPPHFMYTIIGGTGVIGLVGLCIAVIFLTRKSDCGRHGRYLPANMGNKPKTSCWKKYAFSHIWNFGYFASLLFCFGVCCYFLITRATNSD